MHVEAAIRATFWANSIHVPSPIISIGKRFDCKRTDNDADNGLHVDNNDGDPWNVGGQHFSDEEDKKKALADKSHILRY